VTPPWFAALLLFLLSPSPQAACRPETRVVEGRALDVYVCEDLVIAAQGLTVTSSDCIPGAPACMGQNFGMGPAGETRDILMREVTDPYPFATHLATFPYSYCLPRLQAVPRDPYLQLGDRDLRATSPITGLVFGARGMVATGLTDPQIYPLECYFFHGIRLAELLESRQQVEEQLRAIPGFIVRLIQDVRPDPPIRRITAFYGYSREYFDGKVFHEGLDTSVARRSDVGRNEQLTVWTPVPLMPAIIYPGWALGLMPCNISREAVVEPYPRGGIALARDIRNLLEGRVSPEEDCALLFGGLHVVTDIPGTAVARVRAWAEVGAEGALPLDGGNIDAYIPAGGYMLPCEVGYAGSTALHCHYQAVALDGGRARALLRALQSRNDRWRFIRPWRGSDQGVSEWGGIYVEWVYANSFDPLLLLFPELAWGSGGFREPDHQLFVDWARHPLPAIGGVGLGTVTLFAAWTGNAVGEFYPGMPAAGRVSDVEGRSYQGPCRILGKDLPGWGCEPVRPSRDVPSYCNSPSGRFCAGNLDPARMEVLRRVVKAAWRAICYRRGCA